ncbi:uncharacterized protein VICG_00696 [Vittaforma corneae ATCC 50505]|uniref:Uncharacterized protein n=1 Tax=Vittaforma corneae (strain ATCC 50505) TaxID=993615 RepID=L2GN88_VITCO|nr:uncharacterized protein VICG_00696 [Vittaforma corneae ATCC 50505]ELA42296.1 hypothetical protein VICG_00696 [Vittaforma corneae ATCC 50505]
MKASTQVKSIARILFLSLMLMEFVFASRRKHKKKKNPTVTNGSDSSLASSPSSSSLASNGNCTIRSNFHSITQLFPPTFKNNAFRMRLSDGYIINAQDHENSACQDCIRNAKTLEHLFGMFRIFNVEHYKPFFDFILYTLPQSSDKSVEVMVVQADDAEWYLPVRNGGENSRIAFIRMQDKNEDKNYHTYKTRWSVLPFFTKQNHPKSFLVFVDNFDIFENLESKRLTFFRINVRSLEFIIGLRSCLEEKKSRTPTR